MDSDSDEEAGDDECMDGDTDQEEYQTPGGAGVIMI